MADLTRARGDTYADEIQIMSSTTGLALDITGFSFLLTIDPDRFPTGSGNNLYQLTGVITDAANGLVEFAPSAVQADQTPGRYWYDVQMTDNTGRIRTIQSGRYTFTQDITK